MNNLTVKVLIILLMEFTLLSTLYAHGDHSTPCSGPHKNDPICIAPAVPPPPPAISIKSVTINWLDEMIIVYGNNFSVDTTITIAGNSATIDSWSANQINIPFTGLIANTPKGNHNLVANDIPSSSTSSLSLFAKAEILDKMATGCPCDQGSPGAAWSNEVSAFWGTPPSLTECLELSPGGIGNPEDIAGTLLSTPGDSSVYPQYPIGAAFTAEPEESVCQLTRVSAPFSLPTDLIKIRINRLQQEVCHATLVANVCNTIIFVP